VKESSVVLGVSWTKDVTDSPQSECTQMDGTRFTAYIAAGVGHTVSVQESVDLKWFRIT
jgi:acetylxylan esterase